MSKKSSPKPRTILHEVTKEGKHRIVLVEAGEPHRHSPWFQKAEVGYFEGYSCSTRESDAIPAGIFKAVPVKHQQLA